MDQLFALFSPAQLVVACTIAVIAGVVKGLVGFAMPMVLVSGLSLFLPAEIALAGLILPTVVTNGMQALRQGLAAAWTSVRRFRVFLAIGAVCLLLSAQLVRILPGPVMLLMIGVPVTGFAIAQLLGWQLRLRDPGPKSEAAIGAFAGFVGGFSGVWGPPTVAYLTAIHTEKTEQMRVQGVIYGLGAVMLVGAHLGSGVLRAETVPFSALLVAPAVLGMVIGSAMNQRIDQAAFRRATLVVLAIAGTALVGRGLLG